MTKEKIIYINYFLFIFLLIVLLFKPYQNFFWDSEPDYLVNAFHILEWNIPWVGHHPATIIQYLYAGIIKLNN